MRVNNFPIIMLLKEKNSIFISHNVNTKITFKDGGNNGNYAFA